MAICDSMRRSLLSLIVMTLDENMSSANGIPYQPDSQQGLVIVTI